jgi:hypothetical protein
MPKFYFDCQVYGKLARDHEGIDLPDLKAAEREAIESAVGIGCDEFPMLAGEGMVVVTVRDDGHRPVLKVTASMALKIDQLD